MTGRHPYDLGWPDAYPGYDPDDAAARYYAEFGILDEDFYGDPDPPQTEEEIALDMIHDAQERDLMAGMYD